MTTPHSDDQSSALAGGSVIRAAREEAMRLGLVALARWLRARVQADHDEKTTMTMLSRKVCDIHARVRKAGARAALGGVEVVECKACLGNGFYIMCAGDGEWREECESCSGAGFVPAPNVGHEPRL